MRRLAPRLTLFPTRRRPWDPPPRSCPAGGPAYARPPAGRAQPGGAEGTHCQGGPGAQLRVSETDHTLREFLELKALMAWGVGRTPRNR